MPQNQTTQRAQPGIDHPDMIRRDMALSVRAAEGDDAPAVIDASVSSETPAMDFMYWNESYQRVMLVLDHSETAIDRTHIADGLVIRDSHWGDQVAMIREPAVQDGKLGGTMEFCAGERAENLARDCASGLRRSMSVEAFVDLDSLEQTGDEGGIPILVARRWTPTGAALTSNPPADPYVGVSRDAPNIATHTSQEDSPMPDENTPETPVVRSAEETMKLISLARFNDVPVERTDKAIADGESYEDFSTWMMREHKRPVAEVSRQTQDEPSEMDAPDLAAYSINRAIMSQVPGSGVEGGFEREVSEQIAKDCDRPPQGRYVPTQVLCRDLQTDGTGGNLVATDLMSGSFIDLLRNKPAIMQLGATLLSGLRGDIAIPKQTGATTAYWVSEGNAPTESTPTLKQLEGRPHTVGAYTDISRRMLLQPSLSAQQFVTNDITTVLALAIDTAAIQGSGVGGQPKGVLIADDINQPTVTAGTPTYAQILNFPAYIETDNAAIGDMKWLMSPLGWAKLAATARGTGDGFVLDPDNGNMMLGFPFVMSNQTPSLKLMFGVWSQLVLGMWGALDLKVDQAALATSGGIRIIGLQDVDVIVRHGQSFAEQTLLT